MDKTAKLLAMTTLALFFIAGVLAGIVLDRRVIMSSLGQVRQGQSPLPGAQPGGMQGRPPDRLRLDFLDKMKNDLSLTTEQTAKVSKILDANEKSFMKIRMESKDRFDDLDYKLFTNISAVLDEKQKRKLVSSWANTRPPDRGTAPGLPPHERMEGGGQMHPPGMQGGDQFPPPPQGGDFQQRRPPPPQGGPDGTGRMRGDMQRGQPQGQR